MLLVAYTSELTAFCVNLSPQSPVAIRQIVCPGSLIDQILSNPNWKSSSPCKIDRTATVLTLLLHTTELRSLEDEEQLAQKVIGKLKAQDLRPSDNVQPLLWTLVTDLNGFRLESPARIQTVARLLYVMNRLSHSARDRLDHFLYSKLSGVECGARCGTEAVTHAHSADGAKALDLTIILAAIWADINAHLATQSAKPS